MFGPCYGHPGVESLVGWRLLKLGGGLGGLCCCGEGGAGVHPGPVPGHLVCRAGGVSGHVRGADGGSDWGPCTPPCYRPGGAQVWLDAGIPILFFAVKFAVGCAVTQRAVEGGGFGWWTRGGIIGTLLWGPWLVLPIWWNSPQTSKSNGKPIISCSRCCPLPIETTLFKIRIHVVTGIKSLLDTIDGTGLLVLLLLVGIKL